MNSKPCGSRDSLLSFKDDEFMQALDSEFLSKAKLQNEKARQSKEQIDYRQVESTLQHSLDSRETLRRNAGSVVYPD